MTKPIRTAFMVAPEDMRVSAARQLAFSAAVALAALAVTLTTLAQRAQGAHAASSAAISASR